MDADLHVDLPSLGLLEVPRLVEELRRLSPDPGERLAQLFQLRSNAAQIWLALPDHGIQAACEKGLFTATMGIAARLTGTEAPDRQEALLAQVKRALQECPGDRTAFAASAFLGHLGEDEDQIFPAASPQGKRRLLPVLLTHGVDLEEGGARREYRRLQVVTDQILAWLPSAGTEERRLFLADLRPAYFIIPSYFLESDTVRTAALRVQLLRALFDWPGMDLPYEPAGPVPSGRRIRVGILARSYEARSETFALLPVFEHLDQGRFEIILLAFEVQNTPTESYCATRASMARVVPEGLPELVPAVRALDLDILLIGNNLGVGLGLADAALGLHRLARIQVNFICSPITSGLPFLDGFLQGEDCEDPVGVESRYTERLALLPGSGFCFSFNGRDESRGRVVTRADLGILPAEVVFVSGANYYKLLPRVRDAWSRILAAVPDSVLLLYPFGPSWSGDYPQEHFIESMLRSFDRHGVARDRLVIVGPMKNIQEIRSLLRCGDVYLDAFPYSGATSLQDPLDVGLPPVVMDGRELRFRQGAAILREAGLGSQVASDPESYFELAARLGRDPAQRRRAAEEVKRAVSRGLPCRDSVGYGKKVGAAFQGMVEEWNRVRQDPDRSRPPGAHSQSGSAQN